MLASRADARLTHSHATRSDQPKPMRSRRHHRPHTRTTNKAKSPGLAGRFRAVSFYDPDGIRTHVAAVKGRCPGPLDDGAVDRHGGIRVAQGCGRVWRREVGVNGIGRGWRAWVRTTR